MSDEDFPSGQEERKNSLTKSLGTNSTIQKPEAEEEKRNLLTETLDADLTIQKPEAEEEKKNSLTKSLGAASTIQETGTEEEKRNSLTSSTIGRPETDEERRSSLTISTGANSTMGVPSTIKGVETEEEERRNSGNKSMGVSFSMGIPSTIKDKTEEERKNSLTSSIGAPTIQNYGFQGPEAEERRNSLTKSMEAASTIRGPADLTFTDQSRDIRESGQEVTELQEDNSTFAFLTEGVKALFREILPENIQNSDFYSLMVDVLSSYETLPSNDCNMLHGKSCDSSGSLFWSIMVSVLETLLNRSKQNAGPNASIEECRNRTGPPSASLPPAQVQGGSEKRNSLQEGSQRGSVPTEGTELAKESQERKASSESK